MSNAEQERVEGAGGAIKSRRSRVIAAALLAIIPVLGACEADSYLDQSVTGRWEYTPTVVPILERIASVERGDGDYVEATDVVAEDLIPLPVEPALSPGDVLDIRVRDYFRVGAEEQFQGLIDKRGYVIIPRLPPIQIQGLTLTQAREKIAQTIQQEGLLNDPVVTVIPIQVRQNTFSAFGSVAQPGTYFIPNADYRLLEALTAAGGWSETVPEIFVIRQVALSEDVAGRPALPATGQPATPSQQPQEPEELIDLIDELSNPQGGAPSPGVVGGSGAAGSRPASRRQPAGEGTPPLVDLPDPTGRATPEGVEQPAPRAGFNWVFLNGQWVRVSPAGGAGAGDEAGMDGLDADQLVTQRVIRVPMAPLISGSRKYNIVIRPGDIIRVPVLGQGIVYMAGQVARPGTYGIPVTGRLTLLRAVDAAGGLNQVAIPERVDITRMVGSNAQAMVRVNLRAINEGTQPDLFLKPDDRINVGTNFWAYPLAVIRGGFRASYGFGFLLDRNFGNDVFGAPPAERFIN